MTWATLIGRIGMVLLSTGLALGLVSFIPSAQMGSGSGGMSFLGPEQFEIIYFPFTSLTPQSGVHISVESNTSLNVYIIGMYLGDFQNWTMSWVREQFPSIPEYEWWSASRNITVLNAFVESHPDTVLWKSEPTNTASKDFFPVTVSNATGLIANPSLSDVQYQWEVKLLTSLAPKERVFLLAQILIPVGVVLAIPWIYFTKVKKPVLQ